MGEVAGVSNQVWILAGSTHMTGSTGAKIQGINKSTFNQLCDIMEITAFGDTAKRRIAGLLDADINIEGNVYTGDTTGQAVLVAGASCFIGVYPSGTAVAGTQIPAIIESVETSADVAGMQTIKAVCKLNGVSEALPARA
jgi:hypothetical protein